MAKFLSKFQKLNWLDYLIELIIVFLGITIAFYINKQSDIRQLRADEITYLNMIKKDLEVDSATNVQIIQFFNDQLSIIKQAQNHKQRKSNVDSLVFFCRKMAQKITYHPDVRTYHTLVTNGEILKVKNLELRRAMAKYYAYDETFFGRYGEINELKKSELNEILSSSFDFFSNTIVSTEGLYSLKLANIMYSLRDSQIQIIYAYRKANEMISELSDQVEEELNKLK